VTERHLTVSELFYSIQGESTRAGMPCAFIRLSDCNLRCRYCDSAYTWEEQGQEMGLDAILAWLSDFPEVPVELTGGEPLLQENIYPLIDALLAAHRAVLVETNGSIDIAQIPGPVHVILDLKCPDSGMTDTMHWANIEVLSDRRKNGSEDEVKFVLASEQDYIWARSVIKHYKLDKLATILLSPVERKFSPARLAELMLRDRITARLQLQMHRILWPARDRGV